MPSQPTATKADRWLLAPRPNTTRSIPAQTPPSGPVATTEPESQAFGTRLAGSKVPERSYFVTSMMGESTNT